MADISDFDRHGRTSPEPSASADPHSDLILLDFELDKHIAACQDALTSGRGAPLTSAISKDSVEALKAERRWFEQARRTVCLLTNGSREGAVLAMGSAMTTRLDGNVLPWIEASLHELCTTPVLPRTGSLKIVDTSE